jgi:hypothetical protein
MDLWATPQEPSLIQLTPFSLSLPLPLPLSLSLYAAAGEGNERNVGLGFGGHGNGCFVRPSDARDRSIEINDA